MKRALLGILVVRVCRLGFSESQPLFRLKIVISTHVFRPGL